MSETFPQAFGRYQLKERLAMGGMAELFLAGVEGAHGFEKTVVIKRILPHLAADEQFTSMFIAEAKITAKLDHPKIAQTFELGNEDKQLFIVMEYIDGIDALALLRECAHRRARVPPELSVYVIKEVLDALDFAHKLRSEQGEELHIVHRDVSPSNVLLSKRGDVKLVDFGIAHAAAQPSKTKAGTLKGKYGYMSPEQVMGQTVSPKSDIFAAGVVLSEMLMGRRLFAAPNELDVLLMVRDVDLSRLQRFGSHIDESLQNFLLWALRKNPEDRYEDAGAFRDSLDEWLFDNRHRVSSQQIADIVNSLYEDATNRRIEGIENVVRAGGAQVMAGGSPISQAPEAVAAASSIVGSVTQSIGENLEDLVLGETTEEQSSYEVDDIVLEGMEPVAGEQASSAPQEAFTEPPSVQKSIDSLELEGFDLGGSGAKKAPESVAATDADEEEFDLGDLGLGDEPEEEFSAKQSKDAYNTISAAVASVSPIGPDPASRDFDDSDVDSNVAPRPEHLPSASVIATTKPVQPKPFADSTSEGSRRGKLQERSALGVLYQTTAARETGKLALFRAGIRKEIYFKRGVPEFVQSNIPSELFGSYLVRTEVITSAELDMALAVMPHFGGKLGDTLVGLNLIKPLEVFRHLTKQVRSKLIDVATWVEGESEWFANAECPQQAFPLDLDPLEVYGAAAMSMDYFALEKWLNPHFAVKPVPQDSSVVVPELFQVSGIRKFRDSLDGNRTIAELVQAAASGEDALHDLRLLYLLFNTRLIADAEQVSDAL